MSEVDITGRRFGRLTALYRDGYNDSWHAMWVCRCDCGKQVRVEKSNLMYGKTRSCGCLKSETMNRNRRHGKPTVEPK